jgi:hypothetical protein
MATKVKEALLTGYCMGTKTKNVPIPDATIEKLSNGRLMVKGTDGKGNKICVAIGLEKANAAIEAGVAKKLGNW